MHESKRRNRRIIEIAAGFIILLTAFSYIASILLDFNFVTPFTTLNEDVSYLLEHYTTQRISSFAWLATALMTVISIPFYILVFHKRFRFYHYLLSLFIMTAAAGFFITGWLGLQFSDSINMIITGTNGETKDGVILQLLMDFREEQYYKRIASSCIGVFVFLLGLSRIRVKSFPILSSILLIVAGPVLVFYNWYDTEHILRTSAMATISVGILIFCIKLIYSGLSPREKKQ